MAILKDITLGLYYPSESFVHRLDPRTKLLFILTMMTTFMVTLSLIKLSLALVLLVIIIVLSKIPPRLVFSNLRPFFWLLILTLFFQVLLTRSGQLLITLPLIKMNITDAGLKNGLIYSLRLSILILFAALLTLTTSPMEITDALDRFLKPLRRFGVSTHELTLMMTLSLRFIPTLLTEADKLQKAQMSRGARFDGNLIQRINSVFPLILPLFVSVFRRADELALAMDARCYIGGKGRSTFKELSFHHADYFVLGISAILTVIFILTKF